MNPVDLADLTPVPPYMEIVLLEDAALGKVQYDAKENRYLISGKPYVLDMARRVFPGAARAQDAAQRQFFASKAAKNGLSIPATPRMAADLNWLLQRYPLMVECRDVFDRDLKRARTSYVKMQNLPRIESPEGFTGTLKHYQEESVGYLVARQRGLCADEMGLGKTVVALAGLAQTQAFPTLIVVEPSVQLQWKDMVAQWLDLQPEKPAYTLDVGLPLDKADQLCHIIQGLTPYELPPRPIYIIHYGLLRGWSEALQDIGFKAVVLDECQSLRNHTTQKWRSLIPITRHADYVWGLSGTPIYNYGAEIWSVYEAIDSGCMGTRADFLNAWCKYGEEVSDPKALGDYLHSEHYLIRHRADDVLDELPAKRRITHAVDNDHDQYRRLILKAQSMAANLSLLKKRDQGVEMLKIEQEARRATGVAKAPYAAAFIASLLEADEKVVVWAHHHDVHNILLEELKGYTPVQHTGHQSKELKQEAVRSFQRGDTNLFIGGLRTAAGIDGLQARGTCTVFVELDWSPAIHAQAEDRLKRIGSRATSVPCYYLVSETPMDKEIQAALGLKVGQFVGIMNDQEETDEDHLLAEKAGREHLRRVVESISGVPLQGDEGEPDEEDEGT